MTKKQIPVRQRIRKALIFIAFLLFPIVMNYLSPYVIIDGAMNGVVNGSLIVFVGMFISSLLLGRLWCGWLCPAGGFQEACFMINNRPTNSKWHWTKWLVWVPWIALIVVLVISAGGYQTVDVFHLIDGGVSLNGSEDRPIIFAYVIYYSVLTVFLLFSLFAGKRAACHHICWMAPFMIIGRKIRNLVKWPSLRLRAEPDKCIDCKRCTLICPMSLDVNQMVNQNQMEHPECILCGSCVDECPQDVIRYTFSAGG